MNAIEKNRLDLAYKRQLCFLNFILIIGVGSIISLFIGLIINPDNWFNYSIAFIIVALIVYLTYTKTDENLRNISLEIKKLDSTQNL